MEEKYIMKRYIVNFSHAINAYAVFDTYKKVPVNTCGFAIVWGTDHVLRSVVQKTCDDMNIEVKVKLNDFEKQAVRNHFYSKVKDFKA